MRSRTNVYNVLKTISILTSNNAKIEGEQILKQGRFHEEDMYVLLRKMSKEDFCKICKGAFVFKTKLGYRVTEQGRQYMRWAASNPMIELSTATFRDEALTGMDLNGNRSLINKAALPKNANGNYCDPESRAHKANKRLEKLAN